MTGPRPQRIMCAWAFFLPQQTLKLSRGQIQCKAEITLGFRRGCCCGRTRCRAPSCLSGFWCLPILVSVSLANMTPVSDTFHGFQLHSAGALLDVHSGHPPPPGIFRGPGGRCQRTSRPCTNRTGVQASWGGSLANDSKKPVDEFPSFLLGQTVLRSNRLHGLWETGPLTLNNQIS